MDSDFARTAGRYGAPAGMAGFAAISAAAFALVWSVFANDFSITYIMEHSNRALPAAYKFSALWSGQEARWCCGRGCWRPTVSFYG